MDRHYGLLQLHALFQEQYYFAVDWLDLTCHRSLAAGRYCDLPAGTAYTMQREHPFDGRVEALGGSEKKGTDVQEDPEDIPMSYLLYVLLAIVGIVAGAMFLVVKML